MSQTLIHDPSTDTTAAADPWGAHGTSGVPVGDEPPTRRGAAGRGAAGRGGLRRHPRALTALVASGALLVGLFAGFGIGRATAPDPFAGMVRVGTGAPADGTTLPAAPPGTSTDSTTTDGTTGTAGTTAPDLTTALDAARTGPAVYLTAGLVSATTATTRELLTA